MRTSEQIAEDIAEAQSVISYKIGGKEYTRVPYGKEPAWQKILGFPGDPCYAICHDCKTKMGDLHQPGCDMEACPKCGRQSISCGCDDD